MTSAKRCLVAPIIAFSLALFSRPALGQQTDDRWLVALGFVPFALRYESWKWGSGPTQQSSRWRGGLGGQSVLQLGRGVGPVVIGVDVWLGITEETHEQVDIVSSASITRADFSSVQIGVGPNVRYLFVEGSVRPFVEVGGGMASLHSEQRTYAQDMMSFYAHVGPGLQVRVVEAVSFDALLRAQYGAGSGESSLNLMIASGGLVSDIGTRSDVSEDTFELALHARISIWL